MKTKLCVGLAVCGLAFLGASAAPPEYTAVDLGLLEPTAINNSNWIVGSYEDGAGTRAFLWDSGTAADLGSLAEGGASCATGVNHVGQVVGHSEIYPDCWRAFLWDSGAGMQDLGWHGAESYYALDVNESGDVVGYCLIAGGSRGFFWSGPLGMCDLGSASGVHQKATGINNFAQIVGEMGTIPRPFCWEYWAWPNPLDVAGYQPGQGCALDINDSGQVVGHFASEAFLWDSDSGMGSLGTLGGDASCARAINESGQVVGDANIEQGSAVSHAFLWAGGDMYDLNYLVRPHFGGTVESAVGINDEGWIVGTGKNRDGDVRGFLLALVPEGDATLDGCVNGLDYNEWSLHYQMTGLTWTQGDFNGDAAADGLDYNIWSLNYLSGCAGTGWDVPEPSFALLLIAALAPTLWRRPKG